MRLTVVDADDARLADYVRLREASLRRHLESERGLVHRRGREGHPPRRRGRVPAAVVPAGRALARRAGRCAESWPDVPVFVVTEDLAEQVTGFHVHRGALACCTARNATGVDGPPARSAARRLGGHRRPHQCRRDPAECCRLGLGRRTAVAAHGRSALPPLDQGEHGRGVLTALGATGGLARRAGACWPRLAFITVALTLAPDAVDLDELAAGVTRTQSLRSVGHRGCRTLQRWSDGAAVRTRIPMSAGIDSLNVAAATAIACYALSSRGVTGQSSG